MLTGREALSAGAVSSSKQRQSLYNSSSTSNRQLRGRQAHSLSAQAGAAAAGAAMARTKIRWGDTLDDEDALPPTTIRGPDNNGVKVTTGA